MENILKICDKIRQLKFQSCGLIPSKNKNKVETYDRVIESSKFKDAYMLVIHFAQKDDQIQMLL